MAKERDMRDSDEYDPFLERWKMATNNETQFEYKESAEPIDTSISEYERFIKRNYPDIYPVTFEKVIKDRNEWNDDYQVLYEKWTIDHPKEEDEYITEDVDDEIEEEWLPMKPLNDKLKKIQEWTEDMNNTFGLMREKGITFQEASTSIMDDKIRTIAEQVKKEDSLIDWIDESLIRCVHRYHTHRIQMIHQSNLSMSLLF